MIELDPPVTEINSANVYLNNNTAAAVLTGIYTKISTENNSNTGISSISIISALSSDELMLYNLGNLGFAGYFSNNLTSINTSPDYWNMIYPIIFITNAALEGLSSSTSLSSSVKMQLMGEARFIRSFCYFYLVNMYGDVPFVLTTDWQVNTVLPRNSKEEVYQQIINDLKEAQQLLSKDYLKGDAFTIYPLISAERVRPTKWAATALLARVYLYIEDWVNAETEATKLIENSGMLFLESLPNVFKKNNSEAIWQLQPVASTTQPNTGDGKLFILPSNGPNNNQFPVYLNSKLAYNFELGDLRKANWVDSVKPGNIAFYYPKKYKIGLVNTTAQEYITVLRLAEQFLIRAEARAQLNKIDGAQFDLNTVRKRAGLGNTLASNKIELLSEILKERQVELFTEWGHRWFDLKRTRNIDAVMNKAALAKGSTWSSYKALYPIPKTEIDKNPSLSQNPEY
jgi:hypothetical protein